MKNSRIKTALTIVLMVGICSMLGCIFGPEKDRKPRTVPPPEFKDLTEKEHVIENLVLSYQYLDIEHYAELLSLYPNKWVAIVDKKVVAVSDGSGKILEEARARTGKDHIAMVFIEDGSHVY